MDLDGGTDDGVAQLIRLLEQWVHGRILQKETKATKKEPRPSFSPVIRTSLRNPTEGNQTKNPLRSLRCLLFKGLQASAVLARLEQSVGGGASPQRPAITDEGVAQLIRLLEQWMHGGILQKKTKKTKKEPKPSSSPAICTSLRNPIEGSQTKNTMSLRSLRCLLFKVCKHRPFSRVSNSPRGRRFPLNRRSS